MLGPIITAGVGVLAFRMGSVANRLASEGKSCEEIIPEIGVQIGTDIQEGFLWCREKIANLVGYTFEDDPEPPKRSHHKKTSSTKKSSKGSTAKKPTPPKSAGSASTVSESRPH